ncbi:MAG: response regulator [bacterium]
MNPLHKILIVDDHPRNVTILEKILKSDYALRTAVTGDEALGIATAFEPDLILLDIMMPGIDGYETCRRLRTTAFSNIPKIIMVSARARLEERLQGYEAGADDFVTKPFDPDELVAKVRVYLRLKRAEEVGKLREDLLAVLSHETRTPLTGLISAAEILGTMKDLGKDALEMIDVIEQSSTRIHRLLEKAIYLSTLRSDAMVLSPTPLDLGAVVRAHIDCRRDASRGNQFVLSADQTAEHVVLFDPSRLEAMVRTLLDHAAECAEAPHPVGVDLSADAKGVWMRVLVPGLNVPEHVLPRLFDGFVVPEVLNYSRGNGLGLAIARELVVGQGGEIWAEAVEEVGTRFVVCVPPATARENAEIGVTQCQEA